MNSNINNLWNSNDSKIWEKYLHKYYDAVMPNHLEIEKEMESLDVNILKDMSEFEFYKFLYNKYFYWKYTAPNRLATTRNNLEKYVKENRLNELKKIHTEIFSQDLDNIIACIKTVKQIKGLGVAGASGLLSLMYPDKFGTVDQFAIYALLKINNFQDKDKIIKINPLNIKIKDAEFLIQIYRKKSQELNQKFKTNFWTPRKSDQILWSIDR